MLQICDGFGARADREALRHGAGAEARNLWEDEPHPMCLLPTMRQFLDDRPVDRRLCVHNAPEVERSFMQLLLPQPPEKACRACRTHHNQMRTLPPMTMDSECPVERSNCPNPVLSTQADNGICRELNGMKVFPIAFPGAWPIIRNAMCWCRWPVTSKKVRSRRENPFLLGLRSRPAH
jgi:hypothetical protein